MLEKHPDAMLGGKPSNILMWSGKMCMALSNPTEMCFFRIFSRLARSAREVSCPAAGTLDFHWGRLILLKQDTGELIRLLEEGVQVLKCYFQSSLNPALGILMFQRRQVLFIKMSANSKVSLRDEDHIASQSICCLACAAAVGGSLGQPGLPMVVLLNKEGRAGRQRGRVRQEAGWREGSSLQCFREQETCLNICEFTSFTW